MYWPSFKFPFGALLSSPQPWPHLHNSQTITYFNFTRFGVSLGKHFVLKKPGSITVQELSFSSLQEVWEIKSNKKRALKTIWENDNSRCYILCLLNKYPTSYALLEKKWFVRFCTQKERHGDCKIEKNIFFINALTLLVI